MLMNTIFSRAATTVVTQTEAALWLRFGARAVGNHFVSPDSRAFSTKVGLVVSEVDNEIMEYSSWRCLTLLACTCWLFENEQEMNTRSDEHHCWADPVYPSEEQVRRLASKSLHQKIQQEQQLDKTAGSTLVEEGNPPSVSSYPAEACLDIITEAAKFKKKQNEQKEKETYIRHHAWE
jgi:hypothetical protein